MGLLPPLYEEELLALSPLPVLANAGRIEGNYKTKMETTTSQCERCDGLGYYPAADGPDDYAFAACSCPRGEIFVEELQGELAHND